MSNIIYALFPALLFTVSYEIVAAALSYLAAGVSGKSGAVASFRLHHPGDSAAIAGAISVAIAFLTIRKIARQEVSYTVSFRDRIIPPAKGKNAHTSTVLAAAAGVILLSFFLNAALSSFGFVRADAGAAAASRQTGMVSLPLGFLVYGILTPFCEETVFRGITLQRVCRVLAGKTGKRINRRRVWGGILISSLLFGLYHGNVVQGSYAFCMGIAFCLFGLLGDRLWCVVVLHGMINIVTLIASQTGFYSILCTSAAWMAALAGGAALCAGYVWFRVRRKKCGRL